MRPAGGIWVDPQMSMKSTIGELFLRSLDLGGNALLRQVNRRRVVILYYHGICSDQAVSRPSIRGKFLPLSVFREEIAYVVKRGYRFVTLTEACDIIAGRSAEGERIATVTFDDGFANVLHNAYPVMQELARIFHEY